MEEEEEDLEMFVEDDGWEEEEENNLCLWTMTRQMLCPVLTMTTPRHNSAIVLS